MRIMWTKVVFWVRKRQHFLPDDIENLVVGVKLNWIKEKKTSPQWHLEREDLTSIAGALKSFTFPSYKYFLRRNLNIFLVQLENRRESSARRLSLSEFQLRILKREDFCITKTECASTPSMVWFDYGGFSWLHSREKSFEIEKCFKTTSCEKIERYKK